MSHNRFKKAGLITAVFACLLIFGATAVYAADFNWRKYEGTTPLVGMRRCNSPFLRLSVRDGSWNTSD